MSELKGICVSCNILTTDYTKNCKITTQFQHKSCMEKERQNYEILMESFMKDIKEGKIKLFIEGKGENMLNY